MGLFNFNKDKPGKPNIDKAEPGTAIQSGQFYEEYLTSLRFSSTGYSIYNKMARSDYQVKRMLRILIMPIISGNFKYESPDPDDKELSKQATFKNNVLKKWGTQSWTSTLYEICSYLKYGHSVFQPYSHVVNDVEFGKIWTLKNLGFIQQNTLYKWNIKDGRVDSILQKIKYPTTQEKNLTGSKLLIFTNDKEGDNFEGESILRAAYGNYVRKELYLKLDMIGLEKMSIGTPVAFVPKRVLDDASQLLRVKRMLQSYVAHEKTYLIFDDLMKENGFRIEKGAYDAAAVDAAIKREDVAMLDSILASFLAIGTFKSGGNSQQQSLQDIFLNSIITIANYIAESLDGVTHYYYVLNFGEPKVRLNMETSNIIKSDARSMMEIIRGYVSSGTLRADDVLEAKIRNDLGLPERDEETERVIGDQTQLKGGTSSAEQHDSKDEKTPSTKTDTTSGDDDD